MLHAPKLVDTADPCNGPMDGYTTDPAASPPIDTGSGPA